MLSRRINRACTLIQRSDSGTIDRYGDQIKDRSSVDAVCELQQVRRKEVDGQISVGDWDGFFPAGTILDTVSAVQVSGLGTFEVVGAPWSVRNSGTRRDSHVEATLRLTKGASDT
jgi:hypothetical protein